MAKLTGKEAEMANEIQAVLAKYGYHTTRYVITRDQATSRLSIGVNNPTADGTKASPNEVYAREYKARCLLEGFKPEWLGTEFNYSGPVTLVGFKPGRSKNFVVFQRGGKLFVTTPDLVQTLLQARDDRKVA